AEVVETHLEGCASCQQALEQLTAGAGGAGQGPEDQGRGDSGFLRRLQEELPTGAWPAPDQKTAEEEGQGPAIPTKPAPPDGRRDPGGPAEPTTVAVAPSPGSRQASDIQTLLRKRLLFMAVISAATFVAYTAMVVVYYLEPVTLFLYVLMLALCVGLA